MGTEPAAAACQWCGKPAEEGHRCAQGKDRSGMRSAPRDTEPAGSLGPAHGATSLMGSGAGISGPGSSPNMGSNPGSRPNPGSGSGAHPGARPTADPAADSMIGRILGTNYRVLERIGAGGMGVVYLVEHVNLKKRFAAKVLLADLARHTEAIARFEVEAHSASQLEHENIVNVIDYGHSDDGTVFLIMELLRGQSLEQRMRKGAISLEDAVAWIVPVCRALSAAHAAGIVHRDMKPDNVFLTERGLSRPIVKVLDFGISKVREGTLRDGRITKQGQVLGSPEYMSPEAARGEEVDARADVYALGIMLYELTCGRVPFESENYLKLLQMHISDPVPPPSRFKSDIPPALERVIMNALVKDPDERYGSVEELEVELLAAVPEIASRALLAPTHTPPAGVNLLSGQFRLDALTPPPGSAARNTPATAATVMAPPSNTAVIAPAPARGSRTWLAVAALVLAAAIVVVVLLSRGGDDTGSDRVAAAKEQREPPAPTEPERSVPRDPTPTAPSAPATIRLHVQSTPDGAEVKVDGQSLGTTPLDIAVPASAAHRSLEVIRDGHVTETRDVVLDRDAQLEITLKSSAKPVPVRKPGAKPKPGDGKKPGNRPSDGIEIKENR